VVYPTAPPMSAYALTLAFGLGAVAAAQSDSGLRVAAGATLVFVAALTGSVVAVSMNFALLKTKVRNQNE
jgi:hypothetical protein